MQRKPTKPLFKGLLANLGFTKKLAEVKIILQVRCIKTV